MYIYIYIYIYMYVCIVFIWSVDEHRNSLPKYMRNERTHKEKIMQGPGKNCQAMLADEGCFHSPLTGFRLTHIWHQKVKTTFLISSPSCSFWNFESFWVFCWPGHAAPRILVLRPWSKPMPPQLSPNHLDHQGWKTWLWVLFSEFWFAPRLQLSSLLP